MKSCKVIEIQDDPHRSVAIEIAMRDAWHGGHDFVIFHSSDVEFRDFEELADYCAENWERWDVLGIMSQKDAKILDKGYEFRYRLGHKVLHPIERGQTIISLLGSREKSAIYERMPMGCFFVMKREAIKRAIYVDTSDGCNRWEETILWNHLALKDFKVRVTTEFLCVHEGTTTKYNLDTSYITERKLWRDLLRRMEVYTPFINHEPSDTSAIPDLKNLNILLLGAGATAEEIIRKGWYKTATVASGLPVDWGRKLISLMPPVVQTAWAGGLAINLVQNIDHINEVDYHVVIKTVDYEYDIEPDYTILYKEGKYVRL